MQVEVGLLRCDPPLRLPVPQGTKVEVLWWVSGQEEVHAVACEQWHPVLRRYGGENEPDWGLVQRMCDEWLARRRGGLVPEVPVCRLPPISDEEWCLVLRKMKRKGALSSDAWSARALLRLPRAIRSLLL